MATNECQVKKWNLSFDAHAAFHTWQLLQKSISLQQLFTEFSPTAWGNEKGLCKVDSKRAQRWPQGHASFSHHHPSAASKKRRQCIPWSDFNSWWVMDALIWPLAEMRECWMACPNATEEETCKLQSGCSGSHAGQGLQLKGTCARPSCAGWYCGQWLILLVIAAGKGETSSLLQTIGIAGEWCHFAPGQCNTSSPMWCATSGENVVAGTCWHILPALQILPPCDYLLFAYVLEFLQGKRFESENNTNTAVTVSLHIPSKDDYRAANDCWRCSGKSVCWCLHWAENMCVSIKAYE